MSKKLQRQVRGSGPELPGPVNNATALLAAWVAFEALPQVTYIFMLFAVHLDWLASSALQQPSKTDETSLSAS